MCRIRQLVIIATLTLSAAQTEQFQHESIKIPKRLPSAPPYAVSMEPLVKYSQRDPLYDKRSSNHSNEEPSDHQAEGTNNVARSQDHYNDRYDPYQYYSEPEPIIEIIIKESNESLPRPTTLSTPTTKEPVHVFYVKYKKNPHKQDDVIYEEPVPALTPHVTDIVEPGVGTSFNRNQHQHHDRHNLYSSTPPTTTLRTIIRPDSETYHGSGLKVTFGSEASSADRREENESDVTTKSPSHKGHYFKRQPPPYHQSLHQQQFSQATNARLPFNSNPAPPRSNQQNFLGASETYRLSPHSNRNYQRPNTEKPQHSRPHGDTGLHQQPYTIPNNYHLSNNNNYQTISPAQIEQYQQQKLFLHQQNLRQHAQHPLRAQPPRQIPLDKPPFFGAIREQPQAYNARDKIVQQNPSQVPTVTTQRNDRAQLNIQPAIPIHYSTLTQTAPRENKPSQQLLHNQGTAQRTREFNNHQVHSSAQLQNNDNFRKTYSNISPSIPDTFIKTQQNQKQNQPNSHFGPSVNVAPVPPQSTLNQFKPAADGEIVKSIPKLEEHLIQPAEQDTFIPQPNYNLSPILPSHSSQPTHQPSSFPRYRQDVNYQTTQQPLQTSTKVHFSALSSTEPPQKQRFESLKESNEKLSKEETVKKKENLAALPEEVPDDLREQLLSSGILGNADIQILDYDKVGDIPIESLPPEALENFYAAGSAPVPAVAPPPDQDSKMNDQAEANPEVEMKVVRFDPTTKEGQTLAETYVQEDATHLDPVVLNDSRYNRYLPLKVDGSQFPLPPSEELAGRIVHSVVVLAPVDYDLLSGEPSRDGRASRVQGVRFLAGTALKTVVKEPSKQNYVTWLEKEKATPTERQSVVLLVTRKNQDSENNNSNPEIFMYDISLEKISKLKGELSAAFVQVAESNSGSKELEGLPDDLETSTTNPT